MIEFDKESHLYRYEGEVFPSVTQVLAMVKAIDFDGRGDMSFYKDKGTKVHLALQYLDEGCLDESSVDPEIKGRVEGWKRFKKESGFKVEKIEEIFYDPSLKIACTIDRFGILNGKRTILEIKPTTSEKWHPLQTAGQAVCMNMLIENSYRGSVHLNDNGTYKLKLHESKDDIPVFLAMLTCAHWLANSKGGWEKVLTKK